MREANEAVGELVDKKQRAQDIVERVDGVIAVDNALSVK